MRVGVIGAGAIGSLVAGRLSRAGVEVFLAGRRDQVTAIQRQDLLVKSAEGDARIPLRCGERLAPGYDLVIFATKSQDLEQAYQDNLAGLEACRQVLTTQNGVHGDTLLSTHFEPEDMFSSIVMFGATYLTPGEVIWNFPGDWILGKPYTPNDQRLQAIAATLRAAFPVVISDDIMGMKWLKLFVNFNNCIPALTGQSIQETFADLDLCRLSVLLLREGVAVVQEAGVELVSLPNFPKERILGLVAMPVDQAAAILQQTLTTLSREPLYGSVLQSIKRGRPSEIDFINGEVTHSASGTQAAASRLNRRIVDMVHQVEESGRFFTTAEIKQAFDLAPA